MSDVRGSTYSKVNMSEGPHVSALTSLLTVPCLSNVIKGDKCFLFNLAAQLFLFDTLKDMPFNSNTTFIFYMKISE